MNTQLINLAAAFKFIQDYIEMLEIRVTALEAGWIQTVATLPPAEFHGDWNDYHQSYRWQKLTDAVRQMRVTVDAKAHDALGDCLMTLAVIKKMAEV